MTGTPTPIGWIAVAAFVVGLVVRALKTDQTKIVLAKLGLPPIPTRALPWVALACGAVAAILDAKVAGSTWEAAAQAGVTAAAVAVFGHELGSGLPGLNKILGVVVVVALGASLEGCQLFSRENAPKTIPVLATKTVCVLDKIGEPWHVVVRECFLGRDDLESYQELWSAAQRGKDAAVAVAIANERAAAALPEQLPNYRGPQCADAGAR